MSADALLPKSGEVNRLENLEHHLRKALVDHDGSPESARAALQAEVTKLNESQARKNDPDYVRKVISQVIMNDIEAYDTVDKHGHFPALNLSPDGSIVIYSNDKVAQDEVKARDLNAHHRHLPWDRSYVRAN